MASRTYRSPQRTEAAARTRARLVDAATALLAAADSGPVSLDAVAKAAGVTRLTVYNQFGSRRALLEAVFDDLAQRGGLGQLAEAMADGNPRAGLDRLITIFCAFWDFRRAAMARLEAEAIADPELADSLAARNARRRQALAVLVGRIAGRSGARAARDLVDVLFALTGHAFFAALTADGRSTAAACALIQSLASDAVARVAPPQR
ncbi:TetR/AcrR family transcriptional regulator [Bradyrhizobium sp. U87765 SZCCT0131]|uniref:TetR/AcrR family transcriptional regulator n=1 Tax=unclassified Bradyrhizobium TaxID=2631580 RepID=UPI001BAB7B75|nr:MULTISPECIES: TetR/AcrR family transcriptional regulator [unclassified Bradyrhizobium]MBR1218936.1 TetR/AcrR family transcriptional regulator [Bradyrhizobium sp. U87765 SZCCT0131]MBR1261587.1 TetR/AcrR family transcriptional regulator [Bradyrhizobium sp. U87765 SZCCT0134]MBR1306560.1 TetR/AcrR family transcriptional regulator [Bradyrhizobium sp. U87765 SZCCT0110]MBR1317369.1 TetR/AcrR family transcriptional regulator [Bradyrhizobium sp. U87765 SZCCT0109]MBR1351071.1 TetR/AcrR family transcr